MSNHPQITNLEQKDFLTVQEARAFLSVSRSFIYKMIWDKKIIPYGIGRKTYLKKSELEKLFLPKI